MIARGHRVHRDAHEHERHDLGAARRIATARSTRSVVNRPVTNATAAVVYEPRNVQLEHDHGARADRGAAPTRRSPPARPAGCRRSPCMQRAGGTERRADEHRHRDAGEPHVPQHGVAAGVGRQGPMSRPSRWNTEPMTSPGGTLSCPTPAETIGTTTSATASPPIRIAARRVAAGSERTSAGASAAVETRDRSTRSGATARHDALARPVRSRRRSRRPSAPQRRGNCGPKLRTS